MRTVLRRRRGQAALICVVTLVAGACSDGSDDADRKSAPALTASKGLSGTWSAKVDGTDAFVAVVANGDEVVGYICDGDTIARWFRGTAGASGFAVSDGSASLTASATNGHLLGLVTLPDGTQHGFDAKPVKSAALYRAEAGNDKTFRLGGWIVVDGTQRGAIVNKATSAVVNGPNLNLSTLLVPELGVAAAPVSPDTLSTPLPNKTYTYVWAAVGDDYASGDGNKAGANWGSGQYTPDAAPNEIAACHRSDNAGAPRALRTLQGEFPQVDFRFLFVACAGAQAVHLTTARFSGLGFPNETIDQAPQLDRVQAFRVQQGHLDSVYVSMGANDAGFLQTVAHCIVKTLPLVNCKDSPPGDLLTRRSALAGTYDVVANGMAARLIGAPTKILVSTYPDFTRAADGTKCGAPGGKLGPLLGDILMLVSDDEMTFLRTDLESKINQILRDRAAARGWTVIDSHEAAFGGHGICVDGTGNGGPWFNTNNAAIATQGSDLPINYPPGPGGIELTGEIHRAAIALTFISIAELSLLGVGFAGFFVGQAVDDALTKYSSGMYHPNDFGYRAYGAAIADSLRADVKAKSDARARLLPPSDVRIGAAVPNGNLTLRWHDVSNVETRYEIEALPQLAGLQAAPNPIVVNGANAQEFVHTQTSKAVWQYRVRACNTQSCSAYSAPIIGTNFVPRIPTGLTATVSSPPLTELGQLRTLALGWGDPDVGVIEHVFKVRQVNPAGSTKDVRIAGPGLSASIVLSATTPTSSVTNFPKAVYEISAASCSRAGCSNFGPKVTVDAR